MSHPMSIYDKYPISEIIIIVLVVSVSVFLAKLGQQEECTNRWQLLGLKTEYRLKNLEGCMVILKNGEAVRESRIRISDSVVQVLPK